MNKKQKDLVTFLVIFGMGTFLYIRSVDFPLGAKAFPQVIIISVLVLTVVMIARSFLPARKTAKSETEPSVGQGDEEQERSASTRLKTQPAVVLAAMIAYVALINVLGFFVTSILFVPGLIYYMGLRSWRAVLLPSVVLLVFVYVLFVTQLRVPLPTGILM